MPRSPRAPAPRAAAHRAACDAQFVADGVFYAELNELLTRELAEDGYSGVEVRVTPLRTEIIIRATRTTNVLGERPCRALPPRWGAARAWRRSYAPCPPPGAPGRPQRAGAGAGRREQWRHRSGRRLLARGSGSRGVGRRASQQREPRAGGSDAGGQRRAGRARPRCGAIGSAAQQCSPQPQQRGAAHPGRRVDSRGARRDAQLASSQRAGSHLPSQQPPSCTGPPLPLARARGAAAPPPGAGCAPPTARPPSPALPQAPRVAASAS
jgi:hypothetical protein